jgi:hypothetical protein
MVDNSHLGKVSMDYAAFDINGIIVVRVGKVETLRWLGLARHTCIRIARPAAQCPTTSTLSVGSIFLRPTLHTSSLIRLFDHRTYVGFNLASQAAMATNISRLAAESLPLHWFYLLCIRIAASVNTRSCITTPSLKRD